VPLPVFHVGVCGPTKESRLRRIADLCEVSSFFLGSAFDRIDTDNNGRVSREMLLDAAPFLHADESTLCALFDLHADCDGTLPRYAVAEVLADLGDDLAHSSPHSSPLGMRSPGTGKAHAVSGPSTAVQVRRQSKELTGEADKLVLPEEVVLALAAYAEREGLEEDVVVLHLYPFGGVEKAIRMLQDLVAGAWPKVEFH